MTNRVSFETLRFCVRLVEGQVFVSQHALSACSTHHRFGDCPRALVGCPFRESNHGADLFGVVGRGEEPASRPRSAGRFREDRCSVNDLNDAFRRPDLLKTNQLENLARIVPSLKYS